MSSYKRRRTSKSTWLAPLLANAGIIGANYMGVPWLAPAAAQLGLAFGQRIKDITGYGAYHVGKNSLYDGATNVPNISNPPIIEGGTLISHKEFIGDVISSPTAKAFSISSFVINPTNEFLWEFLCQIACNYDEWIPQGIAICFKSTSGNALSSVDTSLGSVVIATLYNPYAMPLNTKNEMESTQYCSRGSPAEDLIHFIECDPWQGSISTYFMNMNDGPDKRFSQLGTVYVATVGCQGTNVNLGELWITYQVTLLKPKLWQSLNNATDYLWLTYNGVPTVFDTNSGLCAKPARRDVASTIPFLGYDANLNADHNGVYLANSTDGVDINFPIYPFGYYWRVVYRLTAGSNFSGGSFTMTYNAGTSGVNFAAQIENQVPNVANVQAASVTLTVICYGGVIPTRSHTNPYCRLSLPGAIISNAQYWELSITSVPWAALPYSWVAV